MRCEKESYISLVYNRLQMSMESSRDVAPLAQNFFSFEVRQMSLLRFFRVLFQM